jgi:hypothetical protein
MRWIHKWPTYADEHYTGVVRLWDENGRLTLEQTYFDGARHGTWKEFDEVGKLKSACEYKNGAPWNGVCQIVDEKAWRAEYRNGKLFNGCNWDRDATGNSVDVCAIDGTRVSVDQFMAHHNIPAEDKDSLSLHDIFQESQWKMEFVNTATDTISP